MVAGAASLHWTSAVAQEGRKEQRTAALILNFPSWPDDSSRVEHRCCRLQKKQDEEEVEWKMLRCCCPNAVR